MSNLKQLIEQKDKTHELIVDELGKMLESNEYLKKQIAKLDKYEYDYLSGNDMSGVDIRVTFKLSDLGLDEYPRDLVIEALEKELEGHCMYYSKSDDEIYQSTADEIWLNTHEKNIFFPDSNRAACPYIDDLDAWLQIEKWMEEQGYFPGVYCQDYHGNVSEFKTDEKYHEHFPEDTKAKLSKIQKFLDLYDLKRLCHDNGYQNLEELPEEVYKLLDKEVTDMHFESVVNIHEVKEITFDKVVINIECDEKLTTKHAEYDNNGDTWWTYDLTIPLTPNSLRFILRDDEPKTGGFYEMSLLPIR